RLTGGGTLYLTNQAASNATVRVNQARLRMDDLTNVSAPGASGFFRVTIDNGTLAYGGPTASADSFALTSSGRTDEVLHAATTLTLTGAIGGTALSPLTKAGPGTPVPAHAGHTFGGGLT